MDKWLDRKTRMWLYGITVAVVPILVAYDVISETSAPLWISLAAAVLAVAAPAVALKNITPEPVEAAQDDADPLDAGEFTGDPAAGDIELEDQE